MIGKQAQIAKSRGPMLCRASKTFTMRSMSTRSEFYQLTKNMERSILQAAAETLKSVRVSHQASIILSTETC